MINLIGLSSIVVVWELYDLEIMREKKNSQWIFWRAVVMLSREREWTGSGSYWDFEWFWMIWMI